MNTLWQDWKFGLRALAKSPGFAAVAILTLAIGIGANTALFTVVNGVLLNALPYPQPDQLMTLHESKPNFSSGSISYPNFRDWRDQNHSFSALAIYRGYRYSLTGAGDPEQVNSLFVSSDLFPMLGVNPLLGRTFARGEDEIGAAPIAMIGEDLWARKFNKRPDVLGQTITLDAKSYVIVGVMPAGFDLFFNRASHKEVYVPVGQWNNNLLTNRNAGLGIHGVARLKPGVTLAEAQADMNRVTASLTATYPNDDKGIGAAIIPFKKWALGRVQPYLIALLASVGFVLLIACVNVANLMLTRAAGRSREFAIRAALGAGQGRIVRQLVTEGSLLALIGGALGLALAFACTKLTISRLPFGLPRANNVGVDARVLLFTLGISLVAGICFGLAPALRTANPNLHDTLKESGRGGSGARHRAHGVFVVLEMAMALVLLVGAGLMIRTLAALWHVNPGFEPQNVISFGITMPSLTNRSPGELREVFREIDKRIAATLRVEAISMSWGAVPMSSDDEILFYPEGQQRPATENDANWALNYRVEPDYLKTMKIPLLEGRFFTDQDNEHAPPVIVIDDVLAHQYFGSQNPIGKRLVLYDLNQSAEIVGVVAHVKQWGLASDDTSLRAQMYLPFMQLQDAAMSLSPSGTTVMARVAGSPAATFGAIREALHSAPGSPTIYGNQTMVEMIASSIATQQFSMILLAIFAAVALGLASIGIYGVVTHLVGQRTHEIGVRIALGAQRRDILRLVLGQGFYLAVAGVGIGVLAALALTGYMAKQSLLFSVSAKDPFAFIAAGALLTIVAMAACYIPARRATKVDPIIALRYE